MTTKKVLTYLGATASILIIVYLSYYGLYHFYYGDLQDELKTILVGLFILGTPTLALLDATFGITYQGGRLCPKNTQNPYFILTSYNSIITMFITILAAISIKQDLAAWDYIELSLIGLIYFWGSNLFILAFCQLGKLFKTQKMGEQPNPNQNQ